VRRLRAAGEGIFTKRPKLLPGAIALLKGLNGRARRILLTAGDEKVQQFKIKSTGVREHFEKIYIRGAKNKEVLADILEIERLQAPECVMIGNSPKSDIVPAVELGMGAVWLDGARWGNDTAIIDLQRTTRVESLQEVEKVLSKIC
jgi:putative hydrolase of the HAD superfamily